jgi:hypothetical protein
MAARTIWVGATAAVAVVAPGVGAAAGPSDSAVAHPAVSSTLQTTVEERARRMTVGLRINMGVGQGSASGHAARLLR